MANTTNKLKSMKVYCKAVWNYRRVLNLELLFFFYLMPSICFMVATLNFRLEKACRVNLQYNKIVCHAILNDDENGKKCEGFNFENTTIGSSSSDWNITANSSGFNYTVCKAGAESREVMLGVTGHEKIAVALSFITVLFAGNWADRYNQRKLLMSLPIIGELLSFTSLLLCAIFFDSLPMEFGAYLETYVPALFGGYMTMILSIFSYMTIATPEKDRFLRFGIYSMFSSMIMIPGPPISGPLFKYCGYIASFSMAIISQIIAILCVAFTVDDIESETKKTTTPTMPKDSQSPTKSPIHAPPDLKATESSLNDGGLVMANENLDETSNTETPKETTKSVKRNICLEIFDPEVIKDFILFPLKKRKDNGRLILLLLLSAYFLTNGSSAVDSYYWYRHALKQFDWVGTDFSIGIAIVSGSILLGTFIGVIILNKVLGISPSLLAAISVLFTVASRIVYAFATNTTIYNIGSAVDTFLGLRVIAIKFIGSSIVSQDELSKLFASFEISHPISDVIFPLIFDELYKRTEKDFPSAVFLFVEIFYIPSAIAFIVCYFIIRRNATKNENSINTEMQLELASNAKE